MVEYSDPLVIKGQYQIVALMLDRENAPDQVVGYVVLTASGTKLRHEVSLDAAKAWLEQAMLAESPDAVSIDPRALAHGTRR